jgi:hypothetical protein
MRQVITHRLTFDEHTVTADVTPHGRFTTTRGLFDKNKDTTPEAIANTLARYYRDSDLELTPGLPHEIMVVMFCELDPYGTVLWR